MITLDNLFTFFEFIAEENTYIQHQPGTTGTTNRFSRFSTESTTGQLSKLGYPRLEVVQLPFGLITDFSSSQQETLTARVRVIYKLSDKFDFDEEVTALDNAKKALFQMLNYIQTAQDECPGNSLLCAFDMNSVRYTLLDKVTFSGSAVGCELSINFKKGICWEDVAYGDFPEYNGTIALPTTAGSYVLRLLNGVYSWVTASAGGVTSVFGRTGAVTAQNGDYTKAQVGLGNVDNTSDVNKPVSAATQTALNGKQDSLGYNPENVANKSDSYTASSSTTYASTKALVEGLATKNGQTNPITQFSAFTHFTEIFPGIGAGTTGAGVWELGKGWVLARNSSGASATVLPAESGRHGIVRYSTGASNSYNQIRCGAIWVSSAPLVFKGHFRIQTLSGGGQTFVITCGFQTGGTFVAPTDAIRIFLTDANVLQVEVIKAGVSLVVNTGITVAIDTHYDIVITKADTTNECQFYVNGVNVYSLTNPADIATYVPQNLSMECHNSFQKVNGTNNRTFDTDFAYVTNNLPI